MAKVAIQQEYKVYGRAGETCKMCGRLIEKQFWDNVVHFIVRIVRNSFQAA